MTLHMKAFDSSVIHAFGADQLLDASKAHQQSDYLVGLKKWLSSNEVLKIATS